MDEHEAVERKSEAETTRRNAAKSDWPVLVSTAVKKKRKEKKPVKPGNTWGKSVERQMKENEKQNKRMETFCPRINPHNLSFQNQ